MGSKIKKNKAAAAEGEKREDTKGFKKNKKTALERESSGTIDGKQRHGKSGKVIDDPRFASVHSDPRFQKVPKHKSKVAIDSRFDRMFTDKSFTSSKTQIDKRGKPKNGLSDNPLRHYYRLDEEEDNCKQLKGTKRKDVQIEESQEAESVSDDSESDGSDLKNCGSLKPKEIGEKFYNSKSETESEPSRSESESEEEDDEGSYAHSTSTTDSDEDDGEEDVYSEDEDALIPEENVPEIDKETHRLAVVNMDWSHVKADDLLVMLRSFLPKGGQILSVSVYPSEFGLKRMAEEAVHGPVGLFDDNNGENEEDDDDDDDEIDEKKLRSYELSRLRYYYAVVECDSIATADYLYKTCDGVEFERSSNKLDLRFIPDSMEFKHEPRDVATEAPTNYDGLDFHTRALQHSKIHITWDEDEPHRAKTLKRKFNADQLAELELKEFLASDESQTDEDENDNVMEDRSAKKQKKHDMYRALLQSGDASDGEEGDDQEMEVTFNTDLENLSKRILEKKDKKTETVWEASLRKQKEKKKARKNRSKNSSEEDSSGTDREPTEQPDDFFLEEPSVEGSMEAHGKSGRKGKQSQELAEASRAELELLLADEKDDDNKLKGYNLKPKKSKGKKGKEMMDERKLPTIDYDDPRFSSLFTSPLFALDPTDPKFKRSAAYARQVAQKQQKDERENVFRDEPTDVPGHTQLSENTNIMDQQLSSAGLTSRKEKYEISSLVKSIKLKSKQVPLPINSKAKVKKARSHASIQ